MLDKAFSLVQIALKFTLSFSNRIGRLAKIANEINAKESVVNLAMPHSGEAKAKTDKFIIILALKDILNYFIRLFILH